MKKNMGVLDRTIRTIIAIIGGFMVYLGMVEGSSSFVLIAVAGIFVLTSIVGFCPLYGIFGVTTHNLE
ncbi:DUF2892 domain-containing protein [Maribacter chungangensis]|uniref:DUF2892 domain-containing protein n=1 Tax=Maribacter chungangensis TaxID=1069117 RepID=A0ABW3B2D9_9FLAO